MNHRSHLAVAAALALTGASALAQSSTQQIEVRGQLPLRTDVQTVCPEIAVELPDALARTAQEVAQPALIDVRFELQGSRVGAVQVGPGPAPYQRMLRRAVRGLQCDSGDTRAAQLVALRVRFVDPFDQSTRTAAAAVSLVPASPAAR